MYPICTKRGELGNKKSLLFPGRARHQGGLAVIEQLNDYHKQYIIITESGEPIIWTWSLPDSASWSVPLTFYLVTVNILAFSIRQFEAPSLTCN